MLDLLTEVGFAGTTVQAVARRSQTHASAIYRRWPTRVAMIEEAIAPRLDHQDLTPTGDLARDLLRLAEVIDGSFGAPAARAALPGLIAEYQGGTPLRPAQEWLRYSLRPHLTAMLGTADPDQIDPSVSEDEVFDTLLGLILVRTYIPVHEAASLERIVELVLRVVTPRAASARS